ncbi:MAG: acetylxylan esterase [Bryobacteraceae bacterium]
MKQVFGFACAVALLARTTLAQTPPDDPLLKWMDKIAQRLLDAREAEVARVRTVAEAEERKKVVRAKILEALGGLPEYEGPLRARVARRTKADGYEIENVMYESLPGYWVTANLYRPSKPGRYPGVLLQAGHTQEGKAEPQWLAANLALKGFVSLAFDPAGQGEREQTYDAQLKAPAAGWSVNEHIHQGAQASLIGEGLARYFIHDAKRSLDYLASRLEVDPARLGAAGCSGGGALTTFIGALDARLKAVIPACFPNSYRLLFSGANPHSEMTLPRHLAIGLDTADFVELSAPVPWQLHATEEDYFTPAGAKLVYEEARRWYRIYGAEEKLGYFVGKGGHGTPKASREAMYAWLIRWLKDGEGDSRDVAVKMFPNETLLASRTGHVEDEPGSRKLNQVILESFQAKRKAGTRAELAAELRRMQIVVNLPAPVARVMRESVGSGFRAQQIRFESEPGIELAGSLLIPMSSGKKLAVLLLGGRLSDTIAERIAKAGNMVLKMDPRRSSKYDDRRPYVGDWLANTRADQIGLDLPSLRARDIVRGVDLLAARPDVDARSIRAAAQGIKGVWLLLAAAADPRIGKVWLDRSPYGFPDALEQTMNTALSDAVIHGFALRWEIEDLAERMGKRELLRTDPVNWMGRVVDVGLGFRYRWVLGDLTDMADAQDAEFVAEFLR